MALAININDLLNKQKIESNRIEFKKGWNPGSIYHSICAFANDFDDLGGGISKEDIKKGDMLKSRRYRNRRLGDFLKELDLTEGRSTGVPTIQTKLAENGSPRAIFETTDDRLTFLVTIPVHEGCSESSETAILGSERGSETKTKSSERSPLTKDLIIDIIRQDPHITAAEIAMQLNMSSRGVEKQIRKLRELGRIKRTGGRFGGYWEIVILDKE